MLKTLKGIALMLLLFGVITTVNAQSDSKKKIVDESRGQAYREVIFFEDNETLDRFKKNKIEFTAQVSAVAAASGVSANAKYVEGVMVFTMQKSGLMYEAAVGGQKFKFEPR